MTVEEVYTAIIKSCEEKCYYIIYLINNGKMEEAIGNVVSIYGCTAEVAEEVAYKLKARLWKAQ